MGAAAGSGAESDDDGWPWLAEDIVHPSRAAANWADLDAGYRAA
jgi:hypothetical protein